MIKITIYLQNGRVISAYLKKRQYKTLTGEFRRFSLWQRIKRFFKVKP